MKLWLLDADVVIDLLALDVFDKLVELHQVHVASTVAGEVLHCVREGTKVSVDFRGTYIEAGRVTEVSASADELADVINKLPPMKREVLHPGELESIAVLLREEDLVFCSCDAATIRILPVFDLSERGISTEALLRQSGLLKPGLVERHSEEYFQGNLRIGKRENLLSQSW